MHKLLLNPLFTILLAALHIISCSHNLKSGNCSYRFLFSVQEGIGIKADEVKASLSEIFKDDVNSQCQAELLIYKYSSGKEIFYYSTDTNGNIKMDTHQGRIEAILKIRDNKQLKEVHFIKASGRSNNELSKNIALEMRRILN